MNRKNQEKQAQLLEELEQVTDYDVAVSYISTTSMHVRFQKHGNILAHWYPRKGRLYFGENCQRQANGVFEEVAQVVEAIMDEEATSGYLSVLEWQLKDEHT